MKKRLITVEDVQRANDCLIGKTSKIVLSFKRIRRTLPVVKDGKGLSGGKQSLLLDIVIYLKY